ncbi:MAG: GtrA family protein [Vulcanimicrobiaceae bacterium]
MKTFVAQAVSHRGWQYQLLRYCTIGGLVFCVDVGLYTLLLRTALPLWAAVTIAYCVAVCIHFALNKYWNFRKHDRPIQDQASTHVVVVGFCLLTTIAIVGSLVTYFGVNPVVAKIVAVAVNVPIGFLGVRYLTFGRGIFGTVREIRTRRAPR